MKAIHIKKKLYALLILFFCISLQGTETTEPDIKVSRNYENNQNSQQALDSSDFDQIRRPRPHHARPNQKPNNAGSQNMTGAYHTNYAPQQNSTGSQNMTDWYNMPESQNRAGSFDPDFARDKSGYVFNGMGYRSEPRAVAIQENNKIVVAGVRDDYPTLARYNAHGINDDGTIGILDKTFATAPYGPGVIIQTSLGKNSLFNAVTIGKFDQKIIGVGQWDKNKCLLACYYENGTLNTLFGENGIIKTNIIGELNAVAIQKDLKVVVAGYLVGTSRNITYHRDLLMRYDEYGLLDDTFGNQGIVTTHIDFYPHGIAIQEDKKIILVGSLKGIDNLNRMTIVRYDEFGQLDYDFGPNKNGTVTLQVGKNNSIAYDVTIQKDGKIIVVGTSISPYDKNQFTIIRLHEDGSVDTDFGLSGSHGIIRMTPTIDPYDNAYARSVVIDENDNIVVIGYTTGNPNGPPHNYFSLVRFNPDGILDRTFGDHKSGIQNNMLMLDRLPNFSRLPVFGAIQDDKQKLVLTGNLVPYSAIPSPIWAVARYLN